MQRQDTLETILAPLNKLNEAVKSAARAGNQAEVVACLSYGADIAEALKGYIEAGNQAAADRLLSAAKYISLCQYRGYANNTELDISRAFSSDFVIDAARVDNDMAALGIHYNNDSCDMTVDFVSVVSFLFSIFSAGQSGSSAEAMIHDLFSNHCFANPLIALRCFSHIHDDDLRADIYQTAVSICRQQHLKYFFNRMDASEFLARAAIINRLMREDQLTYELACRVACEPALIGWLQSMQTVGTFASVIPRDIACIVIAFIAHPLLPAEQLGHLLAAYKPPAPVLTNTWENYLSALSSRLYSLFSSPATAEAAGSERNSSRPRGGC